MRLFIRSDLKTPLLEWQTTMLEATIIVGLGLIIMSIFLDSLAKRYIKREKNKKIAEKISLITIGGGFATCILFVVFFITCELAESFGWGKSLLTWLICGVTLLIAISWMLTLFQLTEGQERKNPRLWIRSFLLLICLLGIGFIGAKIENP